MLATWFATPSIRQDALRRPYVTIIDPTTPFRASARATTRKPDHCSKVRDLHVEFQTPRGVVKRVNGVNYSVNSGRRSPCSRVRLRQIRTTGRRSWASSTCHRPHSAGRDPLLRPGHADHGQRGSGASSACPDRDDLPGSPLSSLTPWLSVGFQLGEMCPRAHRNVPQAAKAKVHRADGRVKIRPPRRG